MGKVVKTAEKAAKSQATILLLGESGVGKEILARSIHLWSPRAAKSFVAVNCVALSDHLLESELFGMKKGRSREPRNGRKACWRWLREEPFSWMKLAI